jgi:NADPH2:quinone reductase
MSLRCSMLTPALEAAAIPLAALTAVVGLYASDRLNLPQPTAPATRSIPLIVYGGSSAVGTYVIQLAKRSNIHPIIAVAGKAQEHVRSMLDPSRGDAVVDYRDGDDAVVQGIKDALQGRKVEHAYDATAGSNSFVNLSKVVDLENGKITLVLPPLHDLTAKHAEIPASIEQSQSNVFDVHGSQAELGYVYSKYFTRGLAEGWLQAQKQEECPGGLDGVEAALRTLKNGSSSATKFVFRIADTPGVSSSSS